MIHLKSHLEFVGVGGCDEEVEVDDIRPIGFPKLGRQFHEQLEESEKERRLTSHPEDVETMQVTTRRLEVVTGILNKKFVS